MARYQPRGPFCPRSSDRSERHRAKVEAAGATPAADAIDSPPSGTWCNRSISPCDGDGPGATPGFLTNFGDACAALFFPRVIADGSRKQRGRRRRLPPALLNAHPVGRAVQAAVCRTAEAGAIPARDSICAARTPVPVRTSQAWLRRFNSAFAPRSDCKHRREATGA